MSGWFLYGWSNHRTTTTAFSIAGIDSSAAVSTTTAVSTTRIDYRSMPFARVGRSMSRGMTRWSTVRCGWGMSVLPIATVPAVVTSAPTVVVMEPAVVRRPSKAHPEPNAVVPPEVFVEAGVIVVADACNGIAPVVDVVVEHNRRVVDHGGVNNHHRGCGWTDHHHTAHAAGRQSYKGQSAHAQEQIRQFHLHW
jgi:hypothetical protein